LLVLGSLNPFLKLSVSFIKISILTSLTTSKMPAVDIASVPAVSSKETAESVALLETALKNLNLASSEDEANAAATSLTQMLSGPIPEQVLPLK
jgi:hypothetical protein